LFWTQANLSVSGRSHSIAEELYAEAVNQAMMNDEMFALIIDEAYAER
jgi:hypothetical protein